MTLVTSVLFSLILENTFVLISSIEFHFWLLNYEWYSFITNNLTGFLWNWTFSSPGKYLNFLYWLKITNQTNWHYAHCYDKSQLWKPQGIHYASYNCHQKYFSVAIDQKLLFLIFLSLWIILCSYLYFSNLVLQRIPLLWIIFAFFFILYYCSVSSRIITLWAELKYQVRSTSRA